MTHSIPLNKLVISPRNVRKTNADEDILGLADSIASKGLLQNLVVSPSSEGKGIHEVDAGGRRLRALQLLAERKDLPKNWPVPVIVIGQENATEASLAENLQKVAMNPADEVEAFASIVQTYADNGMSSEAERIANCARRFGQTERYVRQRLALAALAPEILDALRDGTITIAAGQAYASHPDPEEQLKVFKAHQKRGGTYGKHEAREIRDALKGRIYPVDHRLVRYIGLDAYRAAGGQVVTDLFFEEDEREILLDPALVDRLAAEKGEREAQQVAQAEGWLDAALKPVVGHYWQMPKEPAGYRQRYCTPAEIARDDRAENIAIYEIDDEGKLAPNAHYAFFKIEERKEEDAAGGVRQETAADRAARERQEEIRAKAVRLAAPPIEGTPFEGKLAWPTDFDRYDIDEDFADDTVLIVHLELRIPKVDVEAHLAEAERRYELQQQELREEAEALAAEEAAAATDEEVVQEAAPAAPVPA